MFGQNWDQAILIFQLWMPAWILDRRMRTAWRVTGFLTCPDRIRVVNIRAAANVAGQAEIRADGLPLSCRVAQSV
jgi:hypothetical protein